MTMELVGLVDLARRLPPRAQFAIILGIHFSLSLSFLELCRLM